MHLSFTWDSDDPDLFGEGNLSQHADIVPRVGEGVNITYQADDDSPELTTVSGEVEAVHWDFDYTSGSPYPKLFLKFVKTRKWYP